MVRLMPPEFLQGAQLLSDAGSLIGALAFLGFVAFIALGLYLIPTFVAGLRKKRNAVAIMVLNLLLGWMLIPWVIALVWACMEDGPATQPTSAPAP